MSTKVIPFSPMIKGRRQNANNVANSLENIISQYSVDGWEFYNFYTMETMVAGSSGCFGIGATPSTMINLGFVVFKKK